MSNFITLFLAPVLVGIVTLVIEYAVIQPLKQSSTQSSALTGMFSSLAKIVLFATVIILLIATLLVIGNNLPSFLTIGKFLPDITFTLTGFLSDANISLASIIYSLIVIHLIFSNFGIYKVLLSFLPPLLFSFWSLAFIRDYWFALILVLAASNLWLLANLASEEKMLALYLAILLFPLNILLLIALKIASPTTIIICMALFWFLQFFIIKKSVKYSFYIPSDNRLILFSLICWPLNSLIFINYDILSSVWAWIIAAILGGIQYGALLSLKS